MSVRRPAPLVAQHEVLTVGALADRLPGSTRLSQVLAAGAKHLAKHKTADTEAPGKRPVEGEVGLRTTIQRPIIAAYVNNLKRAIAAFLEEQAAGKLNAMQNSMNQAHSLVASIAQRANSIEDMEVLRRMGAYFVLNWLYQHGTPQQSASAQLVLSEALHGEDDEEFQNILTNLHAGVTVLGLADGPALALAHPDRGGVILNAPAPSDFNDTRKAEKRQKVEDDREAKLLQRQQDKQDGKISEKLEAQQEAEEMQGGEVVPGQNAKDAARKKAEERAEAQGDRLGGAVGGSGDYDDVRGDATDDEEDDFEGDPLAQQIDPNPPRKGGGK
jgi:hypothetical protein